MNDAALDRALDALVPVRNELEPDWAEVVDRAADVTHGANQRRAAPRWTGRWRLPLASALITIAAGGILLSTLWPAPSGVLARARAAVAGGPVVHTVYRDELHQTVIDLKTGDQTPIYEEHEQWYDPARGVREIDRVGGRVTADFVYPREKLPPQSLETFATIIALYRRALDRSDAVLQGKGEVDGRDVFWIRLDGQRLFDIRDERYHEWTHEIAVDARTYEPVLIRELRDGAPGLGTEQKMLTVEFLPEGAASFDQRVDTTPKATIAGTSNRTDITSTAASAGAAALNAPPLWLGKLFENLRVAAFVKETVKSGPVSGPTSISGVEICYGRVSTEPGPAPNTSTALSPPCDTQAPYVLLQESPQATDGYRWDRAADVEIPDGTILMASPHDGFVRKTDIYVHIAAPSEELIIAAARALIPVR